VVFQNCKIAGGGGGYYTYEGGTGASAVTLTNTPRIALYDCTVTGGRGGDAEDVGGLGGAGISGNSSTLFLSSSSIMGGDGGDALGPYLYIGGDGGPGIGFESGMTGSELHSSLVGGKGGYYGGLPGDPTAGGTLVGLAGEARMLSMPDIVSDGQRVVLSVTGAPGDKAFVILTEQTGFHYSDIWKDAATTMGTGPTLQVAKPTPLGILPPSGVLSTSIAFPALPADVVARRYFLQLFVVDTQRSVVLGSPRHALCLNADSLPDCNANGLQDYWEIIDGLVADNNQNWIPDTCPGG